MVNTNRNLHLTLRYRLGPFQKTLVGTKGDERKIGYFVFYFIEPLVESRNLCRPKNASNDHIETLELARLTFHSKASFLLMSSSRWPPFQTEYARLNDYEL